MSVPAKVFMIIGIVIGALALIVAGYFAYVLISFSRIEDNRPLEVSGPVSEETIPAGKDLTHNPVITTVRLK